MLGHSQRIFKLLSLHVVNLTLSSHFPFWRFGLYASMSLSRFVLSVSFSSFDFRVVLYKWSPWWGAVWHPKPRSAAQRSHFGCRPKTSVRNVTSTCIAGFKYYFGQMFTEIIHKHISFIQAFKTYYVWKLFS
jgi:hypothetical protein